MQLRILAGLMAIGLCRLVNAGTCGGVVAVPEGLAFDSSNNLWVVDYQNQWLADFGAPSTTATYPGCFELGVVSFTATAAGPTRLAFQASGAEVAVADSTANSVTIYPSGSALNAAYENARSTPAGIITINGLQRPLGVAIDASGNIFVAENASSDIAVYNSSGVRLGSKTIDASGHSFTAPGALAINGAFLYVGTTDGSVHAYSVSTFINSLGGCTRILRNQWGCWGPYPPAQTATYSDGASTGATGIAFDPQGNVYVSYYYSSDVVEYTPSGSPVKTIINSVAQPEGVAIDAQTGWLYVSNTGSGEITVYDQARNYRGALLAMNFL